MEYLSETKKAMEWLGKKKDVVFLGQTVLYEGSPMYRSLVDVPKEKKLEMPVAEDMQMGISIGMALEGLIPITIYPRIDFLVCAANQLVNHLNLCNEMSHGEFKPGIIIRTQIGNTKPLNPGPQHCQNHYQALKLLCNHMNVIKLNKAKDIEKEYKLAYEFAKQGMSSLIIETPQGGKDPNKK